MALLSTNSRNGHVKNMDIDIEEEKVRIVPKLLSLCKKVAYKHVCNGYNILPFPERLTEDAYTFGIECVFKFIKKIKKDAKRDWRCGGEKHLFYSKLSELNQHLLAHVYCYDSKKVSELLGHIVSQKQKKLSEESQYNNLIDRVVFRAGVWKQKEKSQGFYKSYECYMEEYERELTGKERELVSEKERTLISKSSPLYKLGCGELTMEEFQLAEHGLEYCDIVDMWVWPRDKEVIENVFKEPVSWEDCINMGIVNDKDYSKLEKRDERGPVIVHEEISEGIEIFV